MMMLDKARILYSGLEIVVERRRLVEAQAMVAATTPEARLALGVHTEKALKSVAPRIASRQFTQTEAAFFQYNLVVWEALRRYNDNDASVRHGDGRPHS